MSNFETAFALLITAEGGISNDKDDAGGLTAFGVTQPFLDGLIENNLVSDNTKITDLTANMVKDGYKKLYWDKIGISNIMSQQLANEIMLAAINMDTYNTTHYNAIKLLQMALNAIRQPNLYFRLEQDGILGNASFDAISKSNTSILLGAYLGTLEYRYQRLVEIHPEYEKFLPSWERRLRLGLTK